MPVPGADVAGRRQRALQRLLHSLARNRNQTKVVELENLRRSAVVLQLLFQRSHHAVAVLALIHVDEVDDDDAAQIAQPNLTHNLRNRIEVRLDDRVFQPRRLADKLAGVDVDRDQRLGLVDHDRSTRLQPHLRPQRLVDLLGDAELLEQRRLLRVELYAANQRRLEALQEAQNALVVRLQYRPRSPRKLSVTWSRRMRSTRFRS